jgi:hypothetical protein
MDIRSLTVIERATVGYSTKISLGTPVAAPITNAQSSRGVTVALEGFKTIDINPGRKVQIGNVHAGGLTRGLHRSAVLQQPIENGHRDFVETVGHLPIMNLRPERRKAAQILAV